MALSYDFRYVENLVEIKKSPFIASLDLPRKINWHSISINIVCKLLTSTLYYYNEDGRRMKKELR
jgi:hypothetical protein